MRIALLAPPYLPVPPKGYGGTEKIVSLLADGLVDLGHEVTLFATGDSQTKGRLVSIFPQSIGNSGLTKGDALFPLLHYIECFKRQSEFDLIHNHGQYLAMFLADYVETPVVHTIHGSYYKDEVPESKRMVLDKFKHHRFISISNNQRQGFPELNYIGTVYNGLDTNEYTYIESPKGDYLLWIGRIVEKKGPEIAIKVARRLQIPLIIAAAVDPIDRPYFEQVIKPEIDGKLITFVGELTHERLNSLYGDALCTLFPITWHEPFGLVMIESMACGTPVVAYNIGSVPEIIVHGKTGFIVEIKEGIEGLGDAVLRIREINRLECRRRVEENFTKQKMVNDYFLVYQKILSNK